MSKWYSAEFKAIWKIFCSLWRKQKCLDNQIQEDLYNTFFLMKVKENKKKTFRANLKLVNLQNVFTLGSW